MSRDMGPHARCAGNLVPSAQPFQLPLPAAPAGGYDVGAVASALKADLKSSPAHGALYARVALSCATSFRQTDYVGGCNGALVRFEQTQALPRNAPLALSKGLAALQPLKDRFGDALPWADLITLAGHVALENAGAPVQHQVSTTRRLERAPPQAHTRAVQRPASSVRPHPLPKSPVRAHLSELASRLSSSARVAPTLRVTSGSWCSRGTRRTASRT